MNDVSLIGLGAMGQALAGSLINAGHKVTVWNRTASKAEPLVERGAIQARTVEEAIHASPVTIICLLDYSAVRETIEPAAEALSGRLLINLTNGTPREARELSVWAERERIGYIDGGIMAIPSMIGADGASIFYSGCREDLLDKQKTLLESLGKVVFAGAEPGAASLLDLALNGAMYGMVGGALTAMATVNSAVEAEAFTNDHLIPYLNGIASFLPHLARQIDNGSFGENVTATLAMQSIGFRNIRRASEEQGVSTELLDPIQSLLDRGVAAGLGGEEFSSIVKLLAPGKFGISQ
ncbi:NAD(P)-dependent oxidoreductase [Aminobacter sp. LjRoot7]|uniref:NAD(P)-dependent oxidoreductase n=1 Tax=Aminobacter sp. LjRoot7 TaxID=3342335 RepID=UPI003ECD0FE1